MASIRQIVFAGLTVSALGSSLVLGQSSIRGPILGITPDASGSALRSIIGIPGASLVGDRIELDTAIRNVNVSPKQDYAIAVSTNDEQLVIIALIDDATVTLPVAGSLPGADVIALSPSGSVAAVYHSDPGIIQVIGRLPLNREVIREFDLSSIPGRANTIAISDDGTYALARVANADINELWILDESTGPRRVSADQPNASAFLPNRSGTRVDAVFTDDLTHTASLVMDVGGAAIQIPLVSQENGIFSSVAVSADGRQLFVADAEAGAIGVTDIETQATTWLSCDCRPTGFSRLRGTSIFRLNESSENPVMVLDVTSSEPRILLIPSKPLTGPEPE